MSDALHQPLLPPTWRYDVYDERGVSFPLIAGGAGEEDPPPPGDDPAGSTITIPTEDEGGGGDGGAAKQQVTQPPAANGQTFTAEDIEKARKQERDKLYGRMETMEEELKRQREEREAGQEKLQAEEQRTADEAKRAEEAEMEAKDLIARKEQEWQTRFEEVQNELQRRDAIEEKEREYQTLQNYRDTKVTEHSDDIMPELRDLITGDSPEEVDQSISQAIEKTSSILEQVRQQQAAQRQAMPGTRPTAPPMGPVEENDLQQQTLSPEDIRNMSPQEYMKHRSRLKQAVSDRVNQRGPYAGR